MKIQFLRLVAVLIVSGCSTESPKVSLATEARADLTHGAVQLRLKRGETTQSEVLTAFGAPNIATIDGDGREVWTYRRHATVTTASSSAGYFNVVVFGAGAQDATVTSESRSMTLIVKFDEARRVCDFRSMSTSF